MKKLLMLIPLMVGGWSYNPNHGSIADVTPNVKTENLSAYLHAFYNAGGTNHVILGYDGVVGQAWDINLTNGTSSVLTCSNIAGSGLMGFPCILTLSNKLIVSSFDNTYGAIGFEFNPGSGSLTRSFTNSEKQVASMGRSPDGAIVMGTYGQVYVDVWQPTNGTFWSYGKADPDSAGDGNYGYYISADTTHVYCVVRGASPGWYLAVITRANTNRAFPFKAAATATECTLSDGVSGGIYCKAVTNSVTTYWSISGGVLTSMTAGEYNAVAKLDPYYDEPGVDRDYDNWDGVNTGYNFLIGSSPYSVDGGQSTATFAWQRTNQAGWDSVTATNGWLPVAASFNMVQSWSGSSLLWYSSGYGPVGTFTPGGSASIVGPFKAQSTRDLLQVSATEAYIAGYHLNTLRWNPSASWTLTASSDFTNTSANPYRNDEGGGKYHSMLVRGSNGKIYNASRWERNGVGGSLGEYNPSNGALATIRLDDSNDTPTDLKPAISSTKLVWSSYGDGEIRVFDVASFAQQTNYTLAVGMIQKCVEYESGKMFGISGTNIVGWSVLTGGLLWSNNLPSAPYSITAETTDFERLTLGPDNYVWQTAGGNLYRIEPSTGGYSNIIATSSNFKITFAGGDAYLYGGSTIKQIADLLFAPPAITTANIGTLIIR